LLEQKGYPSDIRRVELVIREVGFEDGSVLLSGTLWLQDPNYPNDPTKKIREDKVKPPHARNHGIDSLAASNSATSRKIVYRNHAQDPEDCFAQAFGGAHACVPDIDDPSTGCIVAPDSLSIFDHGNYSTQLTTVHCQRNTSNGYVDCVGAADVARWVACCYSLECYDTRRAEEFVQRLPRGL